MTNTNTLAPTDQSRAEFEIAWRSAEFQEACPYSTSKEVAFAIFKIARRAPALASQPVAVPAQVEPFGYVHKRRGRFVHELEGVVNIDTEYHRVFTTAQVQAMLAAAPSGLAREPLTDEQAHQLLLDMASYIERFGDGTETEAQVSAEAVRFIVERVAAHGITAAPKGGQHGTE